MNRIPSINKPDSLALVESKLINLGEKIVSEPVSRLAHPQQAQLPEWRGADVQVTSNFANESSGFIEAQDLLVRTRHARALTWLIFELRDAFAGWLDYGNKYSFYGALAQAAVKHLAANQPESDDPKPLLNIVLTAASRYLKNLRQTESEENLPHKKIS